MLTTSSTIIGNALDQGLLAIDTLGGGTNLAYKASQIKQALCQYHCFLDNDDCGKLSFQKAQDDGLVTVADVNFALCPGHRESELEDLYGVELYRQQVFDKFRVSLDSPQFKGSEKWSVRMARTFEGQGKLWDDRVAMALKLGVSHLVAHNPGAALNPHTRGSFDGLVSGLNTRLSDIMKNQSTRKPRSRPKALKTA